MKKCGDCKEVKSLNDFNRKGDKHQSRCRRCQKTNYKRYYESGNEKARVLENNERRKTQIRELLNAHKSRPCADCGIQYPPYVMDFDHLYDKNFTISTYRFRVALEKLEAELKKCDVVCANCHRIRTFERRVTGIPS